MEWKTGDFSCHFTYRFTLRRKLLTKASVSPRVPTDRDGKPLPLSNRRLDHDTVVLSVECKLSVDGVDRQTDRQCHRIRGPFRL